MEENIDFPRKKVLIEFVNQGGTIRGEENLLIFSDGTLKYFKSTQEGIVEKDFSKISSKELSELILKIKRKKFYSMRNSYDSDEIIRDFRTIKITLNEKNRSKTIFYKSGGNPPSAFFSISEMIQELIQEKLKEDIKKKKISKK